MERAASALPRLPVFPEKPLEVHLLTGSRFWYQTAFCLWTFSRQAQRLLAPVIYDDGSLTPESRDPIARLFPAARFVSQSEMRARLEEHLPVSRFPVLRERWSNYPNIRKLIGAHLGGDGWKLVIDSDLLFFRRPSLLLDWQMNPTQPIHAVDCKTSYGYSQRLLRSLAGAELAERINVGLTGLNSSELDWSRIEMWCRTLIEREKAHYYLEQALVALLVAGRPCTAAPGNEYVTLPTRSQAKRCDAVMHHYVAGSKRFYFQHCWRVALSV